MKNTTDIKISICQQCGGWVRVAGKDYIDKNTKARNEFLKEANKYNLAIKELTLEQWNETVKTERCNCKPLNQ